MKLNIALTLNQNDTEYIKGEELDDAITEHLEEMQIDGWEVTTVDISRNTAKTKADTVAPIRRDILAIIGHIQTGDAEEALHALRTLLGAGKE